MTRAKTEGIAHRDHFKGKNTKLLTDLELLQTAVMSIICKTGKPLTTILCTKTRSVQGLHAGTFYSKQEVQLNISALMGPLRFLQNGK